MTTSGTNRRRGFTLLELILVAALIGLSVAIGAPYFAQSIRGNRLQIAARTTTMAARYARSMAVMRQQTFKLTVSAGDSRLAVSAAGDSVTRHADRAIAIDDMGASDSEPPSQAPAGEVRRTLEGARFSAFRLSGGDWQDEGVLEVQFFANGTCEAFELRIEEIGGRRLLIQVDELGTVRAVRDE